MEVCLQIPSSLPSPLLSPPPLLQLPLTANADDVGDESTATRHWMGAAWIQDGVHCGEQAALRSVLAANGRLRRDTTWLHGESGDDGGELEKQKQES